MTKQQMRQAGWTHINDECYEMAYLGMLLWYNRLQVWALFRDAGGVQCIDRSLGEAVQYVARCYPEIARAARDDMAKYMAAEEAAQI